MTNKPKKIKEFSIFRSYFAVVMLFLTAGVSIVIWIFATEFYNIKEKDAIAAVFTETERQALQLKELLTRKQLNFYQNGLYSKANLLSVNIGNGYARLDNERYTKSRLRSIGLKESSLNHRNILAIDGKNPFILIPRSERIDSSKKRREEMRTFYLSKIDLSPWTQTVFESDGKDLVYVTNTLGKLVFSNSRIIKEPSLGNREVVKHFVDTSLSQGQIKYRHEIYGEMYAFFYAIPDTNLVYFSEFPVSPIYTPIKDFVLRLVGALVVLLVILLIVLQFPKQRYNQSAVKLYYYMAALNSGKFSIPFPSTAVAEMRAFHEQLLIFQQNLLRAQAKTPDKPETETQGDLS